MMNAELPMVASEDCAEYATQKRALWALAFRQRSVWLRACKLGLSVGFLQATINQGDHWVRGEVDKTVLLKSIVSPLIGFTLVLFSAAETWVQRTLEQTSAPSGGHITPESK